MPSFLYRNERYTDEVLKFSFPFDELSRLEDDEIYIGTDLLVDASLYFKEGVELPVYISAVDGTIGALEDCRFVITDSTGTDVATVDFTYSEGTARVINTHGVDVGVIVFSTPGLRRFIGRAAGRYIQLLNDVAQFSLDVCSSTRTEHLRYALINGETPVSSDITIVARHGVEFSLDGDTLSLNMLGEPVDQLVSSNPLISVNGVVNNSIWLTHHPRLNLRISTSNDSIIFTKVGDAT